MAEADRRPRPQYGEYADEGAVAASTPAHGADPSTAAPSASQAPPATAQGEGPNAAAVGSPTAAPASAPGNRLPGVPHNLGVSGATNPSAPVRTAAAPAATPPASPGVPPSQGDSYRATEIPRASAPRQSPTGTPAQLGATGAPKRKADRIITIILLALGAYGALNSGFTLLQLRAQVELAGQIMNLENFVAPAQLTTLGTVGAVIVLTLYALVLIFSIRRLRARKLTFWVPLAAGIVSVILVSAIVMIGFSQSPELLQALSQPGSLDQVLQYLETPQA